MEANRTSGENDEFNTQQFGNVVYGEKRATVLEPSAFVQVSIGEQQLVLLDQSFEQLSGYSQRKLQAMRGHALLQMIVPQHLEKVLSLFKTIKNHTKELHKTDQLKDNLLVFCFMATFNDKVPRWVMVEVIEHTIVNDTYHGASLRISDLSHSVTQAKFSAYYYDCKQMKIVKDFVNEAAISSLKLSERELLLFRLIKLGYREKEIADHMNISISTVKSHKQNVFRKLGVTSSIEALNLIEKDT